MEIVDILAKMDERLARQDEILAQHGRMLSRMDDHLSRSTGESPGDLMMNRDVLRNGIQLAFYVALITIEIMLGIHIIELGSRMIEMQHQSEIVHQRILSIADRALSR